MCGWGLSAIVEILVRLPDVTEPDQRGALPVFYRHWCAVFIERNQRGIFPYLSVTNEVTFPVFYRTGPVGNFPRIYALDEL